jgi:hypothetical protein
MTLNIMVMSIMTLSIIAISIITFSIKGSFTTLTSQHIRHSA